VPDEWPTVLFQCEMMLIVFDILYGIVHHEFNTKEQILHTSIQTFYVQRNIRSTKNLTSGALEIGCFTATIPMFTLLYLCRNFWPIMTRLFPCTPFIPQSKHPLTSLLTERQIGIARNKISRYRHNSTIIGSICRFLKRLCKRKLPTTVQ
jgi:hypothetical protein